MKEFISKHRITVLSIFAFVLIGGIYSATTPSVFSSKSHVALFRLKIENPDTGLEESRNRWIWIRDGLNLKSALVTDSLLEGLIKSNSEAAMMTKNELKSMINIQFTGADENNFIVEVKAPSANLAKDLNKRIFKRIKYLAVEADQENFNALIVELKKKQQSFVSSESSYAFYQDKIRKMVFTNMLEQKQRQSAFAVISKPDLNEMPIWPKFNLILIISAFIGLVIGYALEYCIESKMSKS